MATIDELLAIIGDRGASVDARVAAGEELGRRGDPRALFERIALPAANVALGAYPVTVAHYREFVDVGGYDDPAHWSPEGWQWRLDEDVEAPRFWDEPEWAAYLVPNHPVVGVSAYEAEAYASFRRARLPSSHEWEQACRGGDGRAYPWGPDWDEDACSHRDYGPRCTLAVGICPRGVGPLGHHDLCGNVWQWTSDERAGERGPYRSAGRAPLRVVRGGAWNNLPWSIGCGSANAFPAAARFSNLGFRLAFDVL